MELIPILIKSTTVLSAFLLVYYALLYKSSHFNVNRAFLLTGLIVTVVISLANITYPVYVDMAMPQYTESTMVNIPETDIPITENTITIEQSTNWAKILVWTYITVTGLFVLRLLFSMIFGLRLVLSAKKVKWENTVLYLHPNVKNPMVFGNKILVKDTSYLQPEKHRF